MKLNITKKPVLDAIKERDAERKVKQAQRDAKFKELNAKPVLSNPEIQEAVQLLLAERAERMGE